MAEPPVWYGAARQEATLPGAKRNFSFPQKFLVSASIKSCLKWFVPIWESEQFWTVTPMRRRYPGSCWRRVW